MPPLLTALAIVFVAELGDKTQLLLLALATRHRPGPVLAGLVLGYATTTVLGVLVGAAVGTTLPRPAVQVGSGIVFLAFAVWTLMDDGHDGDGGDGGHDGDGDSDDGDRGAVAVHDQRNGVLLALSIAGALFVSELGDKSQLATATLAAEGAPVLVGLGALLGIAAAGGLAVLAGRLLAGRIDATLLRRASAGLFAAFGVAMLLRAL